MMVLFGAFFLLLVVIVLLGWIVPLIGGLTARARGKRGTGLFVLSGIWGFVAVCLLGLAAVAAVTLGRRASSRNPVQSFSPQEYQGAVASIRVPFDEDVKLVVRQDEKPQRWSLSGENGEIKAPAGKLTLDSCTISAANAQGVSWCAYSSLSRSPEIVIDLADGKERTLAIGPPFTAQVHPSMLADGRLKLDIEVRDAQNRRFTFRSTRQADRLGFEARDDSDQVVWKGNFEYG